MNRKVWAFIGIVCVTPIGARGADRMMTLDGLGPVRIGMTVSEAEAALGAKLSPFDPNDPAEQEACWLTERADGTDRLVRYMVEDAVIARIEVWDKSIVVEKGIKVGDSEAQAREAYGAALEITPHPGDYDHVQGRYLTVYSPDKKRGVLFEVISGKIRAIRTGILPAIRYLEQCL